MRVLEGYRTSQSETPKTFRFIESGIPAHPDLSGLLPEEGTFTWDLALDESELLMYQIGSLPTAVSGVPDPFWQVARSLRDYQNLTALTLAFEQLTETLNEIRERMEELSEQGDEPSFEGIDYTTVVEIVPKSSRRVRAKVRSVERGWPTAADADLLE